MDALGRLPVTKVHEHHDSRQKQARRIRNVLARNIWRGPMNRLEHCAFGTDVGGSRQADRSRDFGRDVREYVAIEIQRNDHIEITWVGRESRRSNVDDAVLVLNLRIRSSNLIKHFMEETIRELHDIVLAEATDLASTLRARVLKGIADDPLTTGS